ncbi:MAG TPA: transcriptional regulator NrdR, partial [Acidimicrobiia bacterium]|nr:transcriptional regulator NrdR [Acidimicrobiia bacterium]
MRCPYCQTADDKVIDSRPSDDGATIRRRRECLACGRRFTTYERLEELPLMVVKRAGVKEPF